MNHVTGAGITSRPVVGGGVLMPPPHQRLALKGAVDNYHPRAELNYDVDDSSTMAVRGMNSINTTIMSYSGTDADNWHA